MKESSRDGERGEGEGAKSEVALWAEFGGENPNGAGGGFLTVTQSTGRVAPLLARGPRGFEGSERSEGILPFVSIAIVHCDSHSCCSPLLPAAPCCSCWAGPACCSCGG